MGAGRTNMRYSCLPATLVLLSGCVSSQSVSAPARRDIAAACARMQVGATDRNVTLDAVGIERSPQSSLLSVIATMRVTSDCEYQIKAYDGSRILLENGETLQRTEEGNFVRAEPRYRYDSRLPSRKIENLGSDEFEFAVSVGTWIEDGVKYDRHLGVWRKQGKSEVRAFLSKGKRAVTTPEPVLVSDDPILALSLSPLPDAPMGSIHLAQEMPDGRPRLITLNWNFGSYFETP